MNKTHSHSSVNTFKTCPKKHMFHYSPLKRTTPATDAMNLGNIIHEAFAFSLQGNATVEEALAYVDTCFIYDGLQGKAREIVNYYAPLIGFGAGIKAYSMLGKRVIEKRFEVEIAGGVMATGYIDAIIYDRHGNVVLVDWKTRASLLSSDQLITDNQLYLYAYVAKVILGIEIDKVCQVQIKTTPPAKPTLTQAGKVSKALSKTTLQTFIDGVIELGVSQDVDAKDYEHKFVDESEFLRMSYIDMGQVDQKVREFVAWCERIDNEAWYLPVNNANTCKWCQYVDLCIDNS